MQDINATLKMVAQVLKASTCFVAFLDCWGFSKFWNFKRNKQTTTQSNLGINLTNKWNAVQKRPHILTKSQKTQSIKKKIENRDSTFILNNQIIEPVLSEVKHLRKLINE